MESQWNSLEVAKLVVMGLTPLITGYIAFLLMKTTRTLTNTEWANQKLIEKRIQVYDDVAQGLNDLLCFFSFVGNWKDISPPSAIAGKRSLDKAMHVAAPYFTRDLLDAYFDFMGRCFHTFSGWGKDARLLASWEKRKDALGTSWDPEWNSLFHQESTPIADVTSSYKRLITLFRRDIGIAPGQIRIPASEMPPKKEAL